MNAWKKDSYSCFKQPGGKITARFLSLQIISDNWQHGKKGGDYAFQNDEQQTAFV
jgi:hypothetical protein